MNRDKQISEMARVICGRDNDCLVCPIQSPYPMRTCAELLNAEGYRKASEVAREIFEEIDKRFEALLKFYPCNGEFEDAKRFVDFHWKHIRHSIMCDYNAELKKRDTKARTRNEICFNINQSEVVRTYRIGQKDG